MDANAKESPVGIFDSGVGGLTIWDEITRLLPWEHTCYLADSANAPYGEKPPGTILELSRKNTRFLLDRGCKLIVVACNTATTNAIAQLRAGFPVPFVGIEPAIKPAALHSRSGRIGVLATRGTLSSSLFATTSKNYGTGIEILEREGEGLVERIESGALDDPGLRDELARLLRPMLAEGIDHLVLGCTHYPLLLPVLRTFLPPGVQVVDCGLPVARQVRAVLERENLLRGPYGAPEHQLLTNGDPSVMRTVLRRLGHAGDPVRETF
ncbi:glutamate racemase [Robiginitalea sp. SC105]|uniref:glutamate racemase n=1 Tax=Robiginitalea sp. SC105 TaxID=2762332 RepID=UPI001639A4CA|nr:glutamate racemase [Robiginitalea sp. SC105]MBC2838909.1 glutamate racemase [Robiginitalea sp. SC105]